MRVLLVIPRNGKHVQVDAPDSGSSDDHGQNQHVEAKGAHGASQDGSGSGKAAAMLRCCRRFFRLNQAMGCSGLSARQGIPVHQVLSEESLPPPLQSGTPRG